ncbi:MAG: class I SAM-dependent methyltransferase [Alcaligenaceae bacterium]|nr:class I SAM-dependent methyltransferase [Alcaligenaceae bacterium]
MAIGRQSPDVVVVESGYGEQVQWCHQGACTLAEDLSLEQELALWLETPPGRYVQAWEQKQIDAMVGNLFGYHAIQVGLPQWDLLRANRIPDKLVTQSVFSPVPPSASGHEQTPVQRVRVVAQPHELPFESQSIDLLVLPHVFECSPHSHQILREVERVLVPEGHVVISGFNPWSLWGLSDRVPGLDPILPIPAHYQVSLARLKDWFKLLSLELERGRFGCYVPPCATDQWIRRWSFMEAAGDRWWAVCGAVYVVSAVKRVAGMRLIEPRWKKSRRKPRRAAVVTPRNGSLYVSNAPFLKKSLKTFTHE